MTSSNKVIIDSSGNEITYYGCATILDACNIGGVEYTGDDPEKLITCGECLDNNEYKVSLVDSPVLEYSVDLAVAYVDLMPYVDKGPLQKIDSQKLGVLTLRNEDSISEVPAQPLDNYNVLSPSLQFLSVHKFSSNQLDGIIKINLGNNIIDESPYVLYGVDVVLCDFIDETYQEDSLIIDSIAITDVYSMSVEITSNEFGIGHDTSMFGIDGSQYNTIVATSGVQTVCAFTRGISPYLSSLLSKYSDLSQPLVNFMIHYDVENIPEIYRDNLMTILRADIAYQTSSEKKIKTIQIEIWLNKQTGIYKPTISEFSEDPYTIYYKTSDKNEITNADNALLNLMIIPDDNYVTERGYDYFSDFGYIRFKNPVLHLDGTPVFASNKKLTYVMLPNLLETVKGFEYCTNLTHVHTFPSTLQEVGYKGFYDSGISELDMSRMSVPNPDLYGDLAGVPYCRLNDLAFEFCKNLTSISISGIVECGVECFADCTNLKTITWADSNNRMALSECTFCDCSSLTTNIMKIAIFFVSPCIPDKLFYRCSSLTDITLTEDWSHIIDFKNRHKSFYGCSSLKNIYIEGNGTYADGYAASTFEGCINVENIYCNSYHPPYMGAKNIWKKGAINPRTCKLYVPIGRTAAYNSKAQWGDFSLSNIHELTQEEFEEIKASL